MCGRFTLYRDPDFLEDYFDIENINDVTLENRYNITPSQSVFCLVKGKEQLTRGGYMRWGLVPFWARDLAIGNKMMNARSETIHEKKSFQPLWKKRHCVIIADSFYEWKNKEDGKQPYLIKHNNSEPLIFAGLWDRAQIRGEEVVSCTMLTTESNEIMKDLHHRMPVILNKDEMNHWLRPESLTDHLVNEMYSGSSSSDLEIYKVSKLVNNPRNDSAECIHPIEVE